MQPAGLARLLLFTKSVGIKRQLLNKAVSGNIQAARLVLDWERETEEKAAKQQRNSLNNRDGQRTLTAKGSIRR